MSCTEYTHYLKVTKESLSTYRATVMITVIVHRVFHHSTRLQASSAFNQSGNIIKTTPNRYQR
jgi:hypothetical protein